MTNNLQHSLEQLRSQYRALQAEHHSLVEHHKVATEIQGVLYRLAEQATAGLPFLQFLQTAHTQLAELLYARNCYVCLYDVTAHTLHYPYYQDERDANALQGSQVKFRRGLNEFVLRTGQGQIIDAHRFGKLRAAGEVTRANGGFSFYSWLGVPLRIAGRTEGVLAVQSYELGHGYTPADADLLQLVAHIASSVLERDRANEEAKAAEGRYRTAIEHVGLSVSQPLTADSALTDETSRLQTLQNQRLAWQRQVELTDMKTRFITMASHEFRTPLAAIHGSVELLMHYNDRMPTDKKQQVLKKISDAVQRMTHMLENVLLIGRTDAGQLEFQPKPLALGQFCLDLLDELHIAMPEQCNKIQLSLDLPPNERTFMLDESLIRTIVSNLLSNAVKYSPDGGEVCLVVLERQNELIITVADQGIGIPEIDQPQLFENFHRASNVGAISGTGLGLSIVKQAVACHQGTISVQSSVGSGSSFTVLLPTSTTTRSDQL